MAEEVYRIEIPVTVEDHSEPGLSNAEKKVSRFDKIVEKTKKRLDDMNRSRWQLAIYALDRASNVIRQVGMYARRIASGTYRVTVRVLDLATRPLRAIVRGMTSTLGLLGLGAGGAGGIVIPISLADDFSQAQIGFETMLKSVDKAQKLMAEVQQFAKDTPFGQKEVIDQAKGLLVRGFDETEIIPMLTRIGDVAAAMGGGSDTIERIVYALGQMRALGRVSAEDMNQLTDAGVQAWKYIAEGMGKSIAQVRKLSEQGLLPADQAIQHILKGMGEFDGMMSKTANLTARGLAGQIQDAFSIQILMRWGKGLQSAVIPRLQKVNEWLGNNDEKLARWGDTLEKTAKEGADWVLRRLENAFGYIQRRYLDNPEFNRLDFAGKIRFIFNDLNSLFAEWWQSKGQAQVEKISGKIGAAIGGGLGGFIMAALGAADPDSKLNESPFIQAGATAGHSFLEAFLEAFDAGKIAEKTKEAFLNIQPTWLGGETSSPMGQTLSLLFDAWMISKIGKILKGPATAVKGMSKGAQTITRWFKGGSSVAETATTAATTTAAATRTTATVAETATRSPWYQRWFGGSKGATSAPSTVPAGPAANLPENYRPAGKQFWNNIPLDRTHSRDEVVRMANSGQLQRFNELEKVFSSVPTPKTSWWKSLFKGGGKGLGLLSRTAGKLAVPLSIGLDVANIATATPGTERNRAIGGTVGGWGGFAAGAAGGAAVGSVVPGLGTAVGGLIGGIIGGLGGGAIGEWIGSKGEEISNWFSSTLWPSLKDGASATWTWISDTGPKSIAKGVGFAVGYIGETLFNGEWWNEKWSAVEAWSAESWENAKQIWNNAAAAIESTVFNGEWWAEKWQGVQTWAANSWEGAQEIWNSALNAINNTLFNGEWWQSKWDNVKGWAANAWESIKGGWDNFWGKIGSAFQEGKEAGKEAAGTKAYAQGGFISRPHVGLVGEAGPEVIIPLSAGRRSRGRELWERAGQMLGVRPYANGGIVGSAKNFIDKNNDTIGYGAGYAEGIHSSFKSVSNQRQKSYEKRMNSALTEAEKIARRGEGHELRRAIKQAKKFTRVTKLVGKFARPIGYAMDAWDIVTAAPEDRGRQIAKVAGGIGGGIAGGAAAGALLGTFLMPGVGTAIGGAIGGLIGAMAGEKLATGLYDSIFGRRNKHKKYARGGFITQPHFGLVGEAGPEAIIPLSSGKRDRGLELWERAGRMLGVRPYAFGGIVGPVTAPEAPVFAPVAPMAPGGATSGLTINLGGIQFSITVENGDGQDIIEAIREHGDEIADEIAEKIGARLDESTNNSV
ncbi:MAG: tape measure protein [Paenibacillus macerans]|uniref:tape measure protein n=1 Tax=Paenibacillus macerans TaxID=44252 RepID=UPI001F0F4901|nr:tape measure protein [Paenibacillus macerans]MDU7473627.1 tape measure protein [Paenibacillus macerans]MEC0139211.1 tape measure protein [Paenibacillus macerans]UMV47292.1 tape measure protein [Paenibacillus macerans]